MQMPHLPRQVRQRAPVDDSTRSPAPPTGWRSSRTSTARTSPTGPRVGGAERAGCTAPPDSSRERPPRPQAAEDLGAPGGAGGRRPAQARHPFMGARPLRSCSPAEGTALSRGAAGRVVRHCLERRLIRPVVWLRGRAGARKKRDFSGVHAQRWKYGARAKNPGELVQIDHRTVHRDGRALGEFRRASVRSVRPRHPLHGQPGVLARRREPRQALP